jgi:hypothetical protein
MVDSLWEPWSITQNAQHSNEPTLISNTVLDQQPHRNLTKLDDEELLRQYEAVVAQNLQKEANLRAANDRPQSTATPNDTNALSSDWKDTNPSASEQLSYAKKDHGFRRAPLDPARYEQQILANLQRLQQRRAQENQVITENNLEATPRVPSYPGHLIFKQGDLDQVDPTVYGNITEEERRARLRQQLAGRRPPATTSPTEPYEIRPLAAIPQPHTHKVASPLFYTPIDPPFVADSVIVPTEVSQPEPIELPIPYGSGNNV